MQLQSLGGGAFSTKSFLVKSNSHVLEPKFVLQNCVAGQFPFTLQQGLLRSFKWLVSNALRLSPPLKPTQSETRKQSQFILNQPEFRARV